MPHDAMSEPRHVVDRHPRPPLRQRADLRPSTHRRRGRRRRRVAERSNHQRRAHPPDPRQSRAAGHRGRGRRDRHDGRRLLEHRSVAALVPRGRRSRSRPTSPRHQRRPPRDRHSDRHLDRQRSGPDLREPRRRRGSGTDDRSDGGIRRTVEHQHQPAVHPEDHPTGRRGGLEGLHRPRHGAERRRQAGDDVGVQQRACRASRSRC